MMWQHFAPLVLLGNQCSANVATTMTLPQNRVETLIGSQVNYEIKLNYGYTSIE